MKTACMVAHIWNCTNSQTVQWNFWKHKNCFSSLLLQITHTFAQITYSLIHKIICSLVIVEQPFLFFLNGVFLLVMRVMYKLQSTTFLLYIIQIVFFPILTPLYMKALICKIVYVFMYSVVWKHLCLLVSLSLTLLSPFFTL